MDKNNILEIEFVSIKIEMIYNCRKKIMEVINWEAVTLKEISFNLPMCLAGLVLDFLFHNNVSEFAQNVLDPGQMGFNALRINLT